MKPRRSAALADFIRPLLGLAGLGLIWIASASGAIGAATRALLAPLALH